MFEPIANLVAPDRQRDSLTAGLEPHEKEESVLG
jgi:hypothetical protein